MIRRSLSLGVDGSWSINKLFCHLEEIIAKHHSYFQDLEYHNYLGNNQFFSFYVT